MRTLGIDLASQPSATAACVLAWTGSGADVEHLAVGAEDDTLVALAQHVDGAGIDAPFGWPDDFVSLVSAWHAGTTEPQPGWSNARRDALRFRLTDELARRATGRWPLSPSTDLVALPALRCAGLLSRLGVTDRSGALGVVEAYPAAALAAWGLPSTGYKGSEGAELRRSIIVSLRSAAPWLRMAQRDADAIAASADALDALLASMIARAWALGLAPRPTDDQRDRAKREGWIALPAQGSLRRLPG